MKLQNPGSPESSTDPDIPFASRPECKRPDNTRSGRESMFRKKCCLFAKITALPIVAVAQDHRRKRTCSIWYISRRKNPVITYPNAVHFGTIHLLFLPIWICLPDSDQYLIFPASLNTSCQARLFQPGKCLTVCIDPRGSQESIWRLFSVVSMKLMSYRYVTVSASSFLLL